jgi:hypothetical protein
MRTFCWARDVDAASQACQSVAHGQRERLLREILALEDESRTRPSRVRATRIAWPDVEARATRIVGDRVLPNLVLLERGEETS